MVFNTMKCILKHIIYKISFFQKISIDKSINDESK